MNNMENADFRNLIKTNKLKGVYFFYGEEEYMKQFCLNAVREAILGEDKNIFNHIIINNENYSAALFENSLAPFPVFGEYKLIELHSVGLEEMDETDTEDFISVLSEIPKYDHNIVIIYTESGDFDAGTAKNPSKLLMKLSKYVTPVSFGCEQPAKLIKWIQQHFKAGLIIAEPDICGELINHTGNSMLNLNNEIDKLCAYLSAAGRNKLTSEDIKNIAVHNKSIDAFDFANSILENNTDKAFYILSEMKLKREKPELILGQISRVYCDLYAIKTLSDAGYPRQMISAKLNMHEYKVGLYMKTAQKRSDASLYNAVESCFEADVKIKSTALDSYAVLDKLIVSIAAGNKNL